MPTPAKGTKSVFSCLFNGSVVQNFDKGIKIEKFGKKC
jgi:hypothetical protein